MLSSATRWSNSTPPCAATMNARCVWHTPFGLPVVPDVYSITDTSSARPFATSVSKKPGCARSKARPFSMSTSSARHAFVVAQPARVVVVDVRERGHHGPRLQHLVDLLLVLDHGVGDLGVVEHVDEFGRGRILVHRHRHAAQHLRSDHRPVQARTIVADDREVHAAEEALRRKTAGERAHVGGDRGPRPRLPDTEVLLARRRAVAAHARMLEQQPRERVQARIHLLHSSADAGAGVVAGRAAILIEDRALVRRLLNPTLRCAHLVSAPLPRLALPWIPTLRAGPSPGGSCGAIGTYCTLIPAALMTLAESAISLCTNL